MRCVYQLCDLCIPVAKSAAMLIAGLVDCLLRPSSQVAHTSRPAAAIVILVLYFLLLIPVAVCYFRLLQTVVVNPGYIARGPQWHEGLQRRGPQNRSRRPVQWGRPSAGSQEKSSHLTSHQGIGGGELIGRDYAQTTAPFQEIDGIAIGNGVEEFWTRDIFVCDAEGKPRFCSTCLNFKSDRAHHCKEVDRCVRKMDHYCPW